MALSPRTEYTWEGAAPRWERMGRANRAAWIASLRAMSLTESVRVFEEIREGLEVAWWRSPKPHPVVLSSLWKA